MKNIEQKEVPRKVTAKINSTVSSTAGISAENQKDDLLMKKVDLKSFGDILLARQVMWGLTKEVGFNLLDQTKLITAVSELSRNVVIHAKFGTMTVFKVKSISGKTGLKVVFEDHGPGIPDIEKALKEGYSTSGSLGLGLPGSKKLCDDFRIKNIVGKGLNVAIWKWCSI
ncbi:MAG: anti-sigma regulatory factor [Candidatus Riflebacteria bacterium]|nr:anti-sigma regulatory factor [Candidatus Riflebacteria bacterium]